MLWGISGICRYLAPIYHQLAYQHGVTRQPDKHQLKPLTSECVCVVTVKWPLSSDPIDKAMHLCDSAEPLAVILN